MLFLYGINKIINYNFEEDLNIKVHTYMTSLINLSHVIITPGGNCIN